MGDDSVRSMSDWAAIRVEFEFAPRILLGRGRAECEREGGSGRTYSGETVRSRGRVPRRVVRMMSGERVERAMEERVCIVGGILGEGRVERDSGGCCGRWWTDMLLLSLLL